MAQEKPGQTRKSWNLLVFGLSAVLLSVVVISCRHSLDNRSDRGKNQVITLLGHTVSVQALAFGPYGANLTSAAFYTEGRSKGIELTVWDVKTGFPVATRTEFPGGG